MDTSHSKPILWVLCLQTEESWLRSWGWGPSRTLGDDPFTTTLVPDFQRISKYEREKGAVSEMTG